MYSLKLHTHAHTHTHTLTKNHTQPHTQPHTTTKTSITAQPQLQQMPYIRSPAPRRTAGLFRALGNYGKIARSRYRWAG
jgi:carbohydrate-binding DOMON domain-containing protein